MTKSGQIAILGVYLGLSLISVHQYAAQGSSNETVHQWRVERHEQILDGEGRSPWVYRVLLPVLAEVTRPLIFAVTGSHRWSLEFAYLAWRWLFTFLLLVLFDRYLRTWVGVPWVLAGVIFVAAMLPPSYASAWFHPDSIPDFVLWLAAALLTLRGRHSWLYPLIFLGALNRETSVFVIAVHAALAWEDTPRRTLISRCAALFVCWAVPFGALRAWRGLAAWAQPLDRLFESNVSNYHWWLWVASFLGAFWILPFLDWRRMPPELRRLVVLLTPYLGLQLVFGRWIEARLFMPLGIAFIPMGLLYLRDRQSPERARMR